MVSKAFLSLPLLASLLAVPGAAADACTTVLYHNLTGEPLVKTCEGTPWTVWNFSESCETLVYHPLTGEPLLQRCSQDQCADGQCFGGPTYYRTGVAPDVGVHSACAEPALGEEPFCVVGISTRDDFFTGTGVYAYLHDQSPLQPGVCYHVMENPFYPHCVHIDADG